MANMIKKTVYGGPNKQIMIADELTFSIGAVIGDTSISAGEDGRKIVKAGTPLKGDFKDRNTAFVKDEATPNAILLHDVDVTEGENNGTIVISGFVDLNKLDEDVQALITSTVETALTKITFLK